MPDTMKQDDDLTLTIGEPDDDKEAPKGLKALLSSKLFIVAVVLVLAVGGATVWTIMKKPADEEPVKEEPALEIPKQTVKQVFFPNIVDLGMFEVPLGDQGGSLALKVGLRIEASTPALKQEVERRAVQVRGTVKSVIEIKTLKELTGVDGKILLKNELAAALNRTLETGKTLNVYFYEYLIR